MRSTVPRFAVVAVAFAMLWVQSLHAQALKQVPADALAVVKINNLRQVSDKAGRLLDTLGLAQATGVKDPLAWVKQNLGINAGLKEDGEIVIAYLDPAKTGLREEESIIVLLPVSDYNAFVGNFQNAQADGAVTAVQIMGDAAHISQWGDYAAVSPSKQLVTTAPQTPLNVVEALSSDLQQGDVVLYADIEKIRPLVLPEIERNAAQTDREIDRQLGRFEMLRKFAPVAKAGAAQSTNSARAFLNDASASVATLTFTDGGIAIDAVAQFKDDSYLGKVVGSLKGTNDPLVVGLPQGDYLMYGGVAVNSEEAASLLVDYVQPIINAFAQAQGVDAAQGQKVTDALRQLVVASKTTSFGMLAPTGQLKQEALFQTVQVTRGNTDEIAAAQKSLGEASQVLMANVVGDRGNFSYNENAKTVGGVQFSSMKLDLNLGVEETPPPADETPQQARARQRALRNAKQAEEALAAVYGPEGISQFMGVAGDGYIVAGGLSDQALANTVEAAKAGTDLLASRAYVQPVTQALPQNRVAVLYLPLDQWVNTGSTYAGLAGFRVRVQIPPELPPVGIAVATQGSQLRVESYVSVELIQSLMAAGAQVLPAFFGGGMGDPGGI